MSKPSRLRNFANTLGAGILGSALTLGVVTQTGYFETDTTIPTSEEDTLEIANDLKATETSTAAVNVQQVSATDNSVAEIVEQTSEAIVGIVNITQQSNPFTRSSEEAESGTGSGVVFEVSDDAAYIVTNNHVIEGADEIEVSLYNEQVATAELVGTDSLTDIAVLKIAGSFDITPIDFGDSTTLRAGDQVIAIGNPLGLKLSRTVTQGIASAVDRTISVSTSAGAWELDVIQTDAAINPGNSGGALINGAGQLIGINSLKISESGVEGLGFAIPSNDVSTIINELMENGKVLRPYLGVSLVGLNEVAPYYLRNIADTITDGAIISYVDENSVAATVGLQVEDIIVSINGQSIQNDDEFRKYLYTELSIGDTVTIEFYRANQLQTVEVTMPGN
ncbi:S1C family serine protease [Radiobacillus sp. PE A8.2]|uniref:S1C family serine protease n=1 Tax=Radiobacillus sp. PE A8.2 TaxID=3380349 RepID=UPI00388EC65A